MPGSLRRYLFVSLLLFIFILVGVQGSKAETAYLAVLSAPDTSDFPYMTAYLDVHDPQGAFLHGLTPQDVTLLENDLQLPVSMLEEQKPGVQFVIAITPGDLFSFAIPWVSHVMNTSCRGSWQVVGSTNHPVRMISAFNPGRTPNRPYFGSQGIAHCPWGICA